MLRFFFFRSLRTRVSPSSTLLSLFLPLLTLSYKSTSPTSTALGATHASGLSVGTRFPRTMSCRCLQKGSSATCDDEEGAESAVAAAAEERKKDREEDAATAAAAHSAVLFEHDATPDERAAATARSWEAARRMVFLCVKKKEEEKKGGETLPIVKNENIDLDLDESSTTSSRLETKKTRKKTDGPSLHSSDEIIKNRRLPPPL